MMRNTNTLSRRGVLGRTGALAGGLALATAGGALAACGQTAEPVGTAARPLVMAFIPSSDTQKILTSAEPLGVLLAKETGLAVKVEVPISYVAVVETMGSNLVDVGWLNPFGYAVARKKHGVDVILSSVRAGSKSYFSQIVVHADSGLKSLDDLRGKKFAIVDSLSSSGYLYPVAAIKEKFNVEPEKFFSEIVRSGGHDKSVISVYQKQVDAAGTTGNSVKNQNPPSDARTQVVSTLPDVMTKVIPIFETDPIPNDTVSVRKGLPKDVVENVKKALLKIAGTDEGKKHLRDLYRIDGLSDATDADYAPLRRKADLLKINLEDAIKPAPTATVAR